MKTLKKFKSSIAIHSTVAFLTTLLLLSTEGAIFAAKPKPSAKQKPKSHPPHYVLGTKQLSGENAMFGTTFTLGKENPMNITIKSAEYTVEPVQIGDETYVPDAKEKLLVLHLVYHNPQKTERSIRWDSFKYTIVDSASNNHDGLLDLGSEKTKSSVSINLKPAQKIYVYGVMTVPAKGEMPKLMIKSSDNLVLRYDLMDKGKKNKVKGLQAPYADPTDPTGATALATVKASPNTYYPVGMFQYNLIRFEPSDSPKIGETELSDGEKFFIVHFKLKNNSAKTQSYRWDTLKVKLRDADGVSLGECSDVVRSTSDASFSSRMEPGQELSLRYLFKIPKDSQAKTFSVAIPDGGRVFSYATD